MRSLDSAMNITSIFCSLKKGKRHQTQTTRKGYSLRGRDNREYTFWVIEKGGEGDDL